MSLRKLYEWFLNAAVTCASGCTPAASGTAPANCCCFFNCRDGCFVLIPTMDLVFYALGSGEFDEMACEYTAL
jgi:hypothetical protein